MTQHTPQVSHGRGGAANIRPDDSPYSDGGIVREGYEGDQGDGAYSTGIGGAANIGSPRVKPSKQPHDEEIVPETNIQRVPSKFHTGRGGEGNVHHKTEHSHEHGHGLIEKIKERFSGHPKDPLPEPKRETKESADIVNLDDQIKA